MAQIFPFVNVYLNESLEFIKFFQRFARRQLIGINGFQSLLHRRKAFDFLFRDLFLHRGKKRQIVGQIIYLLVFLVVFKGVQNLFGAFDNHRRQTGQLGNVNAVRTVAAPGITSCRKTTSSLNSLIFMQCSDIRFSLEVSEVSSW